MVSNSQNSTSLSSTYKETSIKHRPIPSIMSSSSSSSSLSSSLHLYSVQKSSLPPKKRLPPSKQPRVYKVKPIHFKELVQQLTGAPGYQQITATTTVATSTNRRLLSFTPPTLQLHNLPSTRPSSSYAADHHSVPGAAVNYWNAQLLEGESTMGGAMGLMGAEGLMMESGSSGVGADFFGDLSLSPGFQAWCSAFALSSPGGVDLSNMQEQQRAAVNFN
ncbi:hypothetical protein Ancab_003921 [Ancistrocladus abbreviatus]